MENQRIRLSKSMLKEALFQLLQKKTIEKITVQEICEKADINRSTFYKYYGTQHDLIRDIYNDFFDKIENHFENNTKSETDGLKDMLSQMDAEREKCRILINSAQWQEFSDKLFALSVIQTLIKKHTQDKHSEKHKKYIHLFFCHGGYAIIKEWLNADNPEPPQEIADLIGSLGQMLLN